MVDPSRKLVSVELVIVMSESQYQLQDPRHDFGNFSETLDEFNLRRLASFQIGQYLLGKTANKASGKPHQGLYWVRIFRGRCRKGHQHGGTSCNLEWK